MRSSISFRKTIGNKYWLSVQPFCSHYSQPSKWPLSHLPLSRLLLFWPEIDHIPSKQRQRRSDVKQKQWERIGRIQETFKKQKQRCLNSLARSQPYLYIRSSWGSFKNYWFPGAHLKLSKLEYWGGGSHSNFFKAPSNDSETEYGWNHSCVGGV